MSLTIDNDDLILLGPGFSLYFIFKKSLTYLLALFSAVVGIPGTILIFTQLTGKDEKKALEVWPLTARFSIGNFTLLSKGDFESAMLLIMYLNMACIVGMIVYGVIIRRHLVRKKLQLDKNTITPSDYSLMAINLPRSKNKEDLKNLLVENFKEQHGIELDIVYINYVYKINEMIEKTKMRRVWHERKSELKRVRQKFIKANGWNHMEIKKNLHLLPDAIALNENSSLKYCRSTKLVTLEEIEAELSKI
jgi:hypothetical protein